MKREIKFRGWRRKYQCWECGYLIECPAPELNEIVEVTKSGGRIIAAVERDSIGQYTNLKDKNGREIYEGDVVGTGKDNIGDPEPMIGQVIMREGSWLIENEKKQEAIELFSEITSREVIGNVWENPELMEVEK